MKSNLINKIVFTVILLFVSSTIFSQQFSFGPKLGGNLMPIKNNKIDGTTYSLGLNAGAFGDVKFNQWFSLRTQVYYTQKKKSYEFSEKKNVIPMLNSGLLGGMINLDSLGSFTKLINDTAYSTTRGFVSLSYIEIPLLATFSYKSFDIAIGPFVSFLTGARSREETLQEVPLLDIALPALDTLGSYAPLAKSMIVSMFPGYKTPTYTESSENTLFRKVDYGIMADITYHLPKNFYLELSYNRGLTNYRLKAIKNNDYNQTIMLSLGYRIGKVFKSQPKAIYDLEKIPADKK